LDVKHHAVQILGFLTLLAAVVYSFYVLMGFIGEDFSDVWLLASHLLNVAVATYFVSAGVRMIRWARGFPGASYGRIKFGRVLLGVLLAFYALKTQLHPPASAADIDVPINKIQGQATVAIYIAVAFLGIALAVSGVLAKFKRPNVPDDVMPNRPRVSWP
jgi:hypothetical protein